jgi:spore coat assembly protein
MIKNRHNYNNIYNYRNSRHFINTVKEARKWGEDSNKLVIFAGACQSYFEAIMESGANFASSPGRILIDFVDPIIVADKVATSDEEVFISGNDVARELKEGMKSIGGTGAKGKKRVVGGMVTNM